MFEPLLKKLTSLKPLIFVHLITLDGFANEGLVIKSPNEVITSSVIGKSGFVAAAGKKHLLF